LCLAPHLLAQSDTLTINNPPSNNILDGIYVGAYNATQLGGGQVQITCDDFKDNSDYNQETYTVHNFGSFGSTLWGAMPGAVTLYQEAAWLTLGMLSQSGAQQGYYSYAIWAIFDPTGVKNWLTTHGDATAYNAVFGSNGLLAQAAGKNFSSSTLGEFSNFLILTPQGCGALGCPEQEFLEYVPEGGSAVAYFLLAGVSCFGAMFYSRRQNARRGMA